MTHGKPAQPGSSCSNNQPFVMLPWKVTEGPLGGSGNKEKISAIEGASYERRTREIFTVSCADAYNHVGSSLIDAQ
ncbi:hypothetical protein AciPR4_2674 [Terriglobus saanensis SP1PR4]|uniref:Uncharacterized protein n=1 Tax=Terriglobus saanensis (strain ATCC BAA-1853 / DSM 23119 / SP1PR4) TaxID=401053 RepID=E8V1W1_TERSS|nr:hypothetical protein AciPR4_2674 [Terriglobus saanensis SP1PR4]